MGTLKTETTVEGESLGLLLEAIGNLDVKRRPNGSFHFEARLEPRLGDPFRRALKRVESELLLSDADRIGRDETAERSNEKRADDAVVLLLNRVLDSVRTGLGRPREPADTPPSFPAVTGGSRPDP